MFSTGEYVVYGASGICRIDGVEKRSFDGIHENEYFKLTPCSSESSKYYIPADTINGKVRRLLTAKEVCAAIDRIPCIETVWDPDNTRRREAFSEMFKSGDCDRMLCLIKSVYEQRQKRIAAGKKLPSAEERILRSAENILNHEFAAALGIKPEEVADFISDRLDSHS